MENVERPVWRKARAMTKNQVIARAIAAAPSSIQAAMICEIATRHMRRVKERYQQHGCDRPVDGRGGRPPRKRIALGTIEKLCQLEREKRADFSLGPTLLKRRSKRSWKQILSGRALTFQLILSPNGFLCEFPALFAEGRDLKTTGHNLNLCELIEAGCGKQIVILRQELRASREV